MPPIRVAIIGLGNITHKYEENPNVVRRMKYPTHWSVLRRDKRFLVTAGSDPSEQARKEFRQKTGEKVLLYADHQEMIRAQKPDLLVVCAPTALHVPICRDAIRLGVKSILCEKPIGYDVASAKKLLELAKKKKVALAFNYFRNFDRGYQKLADAVKAGEWGVLRAVTVNYTGGIFNSASHIIALLIKIFGPISSIQKLSPKKANKEIDPTVSFFCNIHNAPVFFHGVTGTDYRLFEIDCLFERGRIKLASDTLEEWRPATSHGFSFLEKLKKQTSGIDIDKSFMDLYDNVCEHLTKGTSLHSKPEEALQALSVAANVLKKK